MTNWALESLRGMINRVNIIHSIFSSGLQQSKDMTFLIIHISALLIYSQLKLGPSDSVLLRRKWRYNT